LKLSDWQPPFAPPVVELGDQVQAAAAAWVRAVANGEYQRGGGAYHLRAPAKSGEPARSPAV
jgi:hypothetical protein